MASDKSVYQRITLSRVFTVLFNLFAFLFAASMGLDFFDYRFGLSELVFLILPGTFLILALLSFMIGRKYKPDMHQSCPVCGGRIPLFLKWQCESCNSYQKKERYIAEKCDTCGKRPETITCPECNTKVDLNDQPLSG